MFLKKKYENWVAINQTLLLSSYVSIQTSKKVASVSTYSQPNAYSSANDKMNWKDLASSRGHKKIFKKEETVPRFQSCHRYHPLVIKKLGFGLSLDVTQQSKGRYLYHPLFRQPCLLILIGHYYIQILMEYLGKSLAGVM